MGTMRFTLPANLTADAAQEVRRAYVTGGPDNFPVPTETTIDTSELVIRRAVEDSGYVAVPWELRGLGRLLSSTGTLIERSEPYWLQLELARGRLHLLRCLVAEGQERGRLYLPAGLGEQLQELGRAFTRIVQHTPSPASEKVAQSLLEHAYRLAEQLVLLQADQRLTLRQQRHGPLEALMGCRLGGSVLPDEQATALAAAFNSVQLRMTWKEVEPIESNYRWEAYDAHLDWAEKHGLAVTAGPLIEFAAGSLPDWLWLWERDLGSIATFMCDYVATALRRYAGRIRTWQLTAASNCGNVLALGEDEREYLTIRLMQLARKFDPNLEIIIGLAQPWGEYMAQEDCTYSPVIFADTLVRTGLDVGGLDLEITPGIWPRGSYCRDLMEVARLLEMYRSLHVPLRLTLGYPAAAAADPQAEPERALEAGYWHGGFTPSVQAEWAAAVATLALSEEAVRGIHWVHAADAEPHQCPHSGLFDRQGRVRPALSQLHAIRKLYAR